MITALVVVLDKRLAVEFAERDDIVADTDLVRDLPGVFELRLGEGLAACRAGHSVTAERVVCECCHHTRIDTARERDEDPLPGREVLPGRREFRLDHSSRCDRLRKSPMVSHTGGSPAPQFAPGGGDRDPAAVK